MNSNRKSKKLLVNIATRRDTTLVILLHSSTPLLFINPPVGILANSECRQTKTNNCQRRSKWPPFRLLCIGIEERKPSRAADTGTIATVDSDSRARDSIMSDWYLNSVIPA